MKPNTIIVFIPSGMRGVQTLVELREILGLIGYAKVSIKPRDCNSPVSKDTIHCIITARQKNRYYWTPSYNEDLSDVAEVFKNQASTIILTSTILENWTNIIESLVLEDII